MILDHAVILGATILSIVFLVFGTYIGLDLLAALWNYLDKKLVEFWENHVYPFIRKAFDDLIATWNRIKSLGGKAIDKSEQAGKWVINQTERIGKDIYKAGKDVGEKTVTAINNTGIALWRYIKNFLIDPIKTAGFWLVHHTVHFIRSAFNFYLKPAFFAFLHVYEFIYIKPIKAAIEEVIKISKSLSKLV